MLPALPAESLLTVRAVAAHLGVCRATVYAMVEHGELPHVRIGNVLRIHPVALAMALPKSPQK